MSIFAHHRFWWVERSGTRNEGAHTANDKHSQSRHHASMVMYLQPAVHDLNPLTRN